MMEREWGYVNNNEVIEKDNQYTELEGKKKKRKWREANSTLNKELKYLDCGDDIISVSLCLNPSNCVRWMSAAFLHINIP